MGSNLTENGTKTAQNEKKRLNKIGRNTRFTSENQPEKNGRKRAMKNVIKGIPPEAQTEIATTMFKAISCKNAKEAISAINRIELEGTEYGLIYEEVIKAIKKEGLHAIISVLEWIYGKSINNRITGEIKTKSKVNYRPYEGLTIEEIRQALNEET